MHIFFCKSQELYLVYTSTWGCLYWRAHILQRSTGLRIHQQRLKKNAQHHQRKMNTAEVKKNCIW